MEKRNRTTTLLVMTALMTAVVILCTALLRIPVDADCYVHLGDAVLFLCVMILPRKYACFAAPVGAAAADLLVGFAFWVPWTFCIKLIMVLVFGLFVDAAKKSLAKEAAAVSSESSTAAAESSNASSGGSSHRVIRVLGIPIAELIGIVITCLLGTSGYFIAERILFGNWISALTCVPFNLIQTGAGAVIAVIVSNTLAKSNMKDFIYYKRNKN